MTLHASMLSNFQQVVEVAKVWPSPSTTHCADPVDTRSQGRTRRIDDKGSQRQALAELGFQECMHHLRNDVHILLTTGCMRSGLDSTVLCGEAKTIS
jgi:hypothetical protein